jgi:hypothetical protein
MGLLGPRWRRRERRAAASRLNRGGGRRPRSWLLPQAPAPHPTWFGMFTCAMTSAGWHSSASSCPAPPSADVIWSMTPQGAPTTKFSTWRGGWGEGGGGGGDVVDAATGP